MISKADGETILKGDRRPLSSPAASACLLSRLLTVLFQTWMCPMVRVDVLAAASHPTSRTLDTSKFEQGIFPTVFALADDQVRGRAALFVAAHHCPM